MKREGIVPRCRRCRSKLVCYMHTLFVRWRVLGHTVCCVTCNRERFYARKRARTARQAAELYNLFV